MNYERSLGRIFFLIDFPNSGIVEFIALILAMLMIFLRECLNEGLIGIYIILIYIERD